MRRINAGSIGGQRAAQNARTLIPGCPSPECIERICDALETRWLTTRGMNMRRGSHLDPPFRSKMVDVINFTRPISGGATDNIIVSYKAKTQTTIAFFAWSAVSAPAGTDPFTQLEFSLTIDDAPLDPYIKIRGLIAESIQFPAICYVTLAKGQTMAVVAHRFAGATAFVLGARLRGWSYMPTSSGEGVSGSVAF